MGTWDDPDFRKLNEEVSGLKNAVLNGFKDLQREVGWLKRLYMPLVVLMIATLILALLALAVSLENRYVLSDQLSQLRRGVQQIERITPTDTTPTR